MTLISQLKQIPDPRHQRGRRHPLWMVMLLSVMGFLCGYRGYRPLADFCERHEPQLRILLELPETQKLPSYSTFRRSFLQLPPEEWARAFNVWALASLPTDLPAGLLSIDGKSIRCTSTGGRGPTQNFVSLVSVYNGDIGVLQLAVMQNKKSSEIHVAQDLLAQLPALSPGQCFSLDALHTTKATVQAVNKTQQDYLIALKKNREAAYLTVESLTQTQVAKSSAVEQPDESHGRQVQRQVHLFDPPPKLVKSYPNLKTVALVQRSGIRNKKPFSESVYYLSSRDWDASSLLAATREHWQIENGLHWIKDVLFKEDDPDRRGAHSPVNWAILNSFAITLARRQSFRTIPQALRAWANSLPEVFHFLV
jgi:predicted transposase YbfD/YdcC